MSIGVLLLVIAVTASRASGAEPATASFARDSPAQQRVRDEWRLAFRISGGIAGFDRELTLASSGDVTATDRRRSRTITTRATANELDAIASALANIQAVDAARETACRDCLLYEIEIWKGGQPIVVHANDMSLAGTGLEELVKALSRLSNRALEP